MRIIAISICFIVAVMMMPFCSYADSYTINEDEMTISFDDPAWIVFTRDNIRNNKQLKDLGTDYETMNSTMEQTDAYLVAVKGGVKKRIEMMVRAMGNEYINNMNTLTDGEITALQAGMDETYSDSIDNYTSEIVELGENKYIRMSGQYEKDGYEVVQYLTFINGNNYLISAQKVIDFTENDLKEIDTIVENAAYRIDPAKAENDVESYVADRQALMESSGGITPVKIIITGIVVVIIVLLLLFKNRRSRRRRESL